MIFPHDTSNQLTNDLSTILDKIWANKFKANINILAKNMYKACVVKNIFGLANRELAKYYNDCS